MKLLIIFVTVVALANADEDFKVCLNQSKSFKGCIHQRVNNTMHESFQQLEKLIEAVKTTCFNQPGISGICTFPTPPTHTTITPAPATSTTSHSRPTPPPEFQTCFSNSKQAFWTCFKKEANIPDGVNPGDHENDHRRPNFQRGPPPHFFGHHPGMQMSHHPDDIDKMALLVCKNNKDAAANLMNCTEKVFSQQDTHALQYIASPIKVACEAASACFASNPISSDCQTKLHKGAEAFCKCRKEAFQFFEKSDTCAAPRKFFEQFKEHEFHGPADFHGPQDLQSHGHDLQDAAGSFHNLPPPPPQPNFDFCEHLNDIKGMCNSDHSSTVHSTTAAAAGK